MPPGMEPPCRICALPCPWSGHRPHPAEGAAVPPFQRSRCRPRLCASETSFSLFDRDPELSRRPLSILSLREYHLRPPRLFVLPASSDRTRRRVPRPLALTAQVPRPTARTWAASPSPVTASNEHDAPAPRLGCLPSRLSKAQHPPFRPTSVPIWARPTG
uniref:Uncharacterized protein n=1 Tax=Triticum urartu TaxID=4572 RepID=A0A8R7PH07_TRIUA